MLGSRWEHLRGGVDLRWPRHEVATGLMRVGIDFGTTRTVVAAVDRGNYPVVSFEAPDGSAHEWFPTVVAVCGEHRLYGWEAWARQQDPEWIIVRSLKRLLEDAGPRTRIEIGNQSVPLLQLFCE